MIVLIMCEKLQQICSFITSLSYLDKYIYAEASDPQKPYSTAVLASPAVYTSTPSCMMFFANTYGSDVGTLILSTTVRELNGKITRTDRDITDRYGSSWKFHSLQLPIDKLFKVSQLFCV